ncbi:MAG TPA: AfsR/SARP family transcriptional regulator, partial [Pilimelia sp.]|nr:AfsR/SARP family transcriptional regulator [Pilimelia sp.]
VGKTRLAVAAAHRLAEGCPDGAWLVDLTALAPTRDAATDAPAELVMAAVGIQPAAGPGDPATGADRLAGALRGRHLLLVLDNCEHLVESVAALLAGLLPVAPGLRVLATSQAPLELAGEVLWEVPPLGVPDDAGADPQRLARASAVALFVARAAASSRGFALTGDSAPLVAQVCRRLDGIPLALELAATRVRALGLRGLVAGLDDRFRVLTAGPRDAPARQRTLTAVIDWSWGLLTEPERGVLRRLAVHPDGCALPAAEAVCADGVGVPGPAVLGLLAQLVDRSLVVADDRGTDGVRYRLLESVAAYGLDRLREAGELADVRRRHAGHHTELAIRAEPLLYGPDQRTWLRRLDVEAANLRAALDTLVGDDAADAALRLVNALTWSWIVRGRLVEARRALDAALRLGGTADPAARARALTWRAAIGLQLGEDRDAAARQAAVAGLDRDDGDAAGQARARWFLGRALLDGGELETGTALVRGALDTCRAVGDRWGEAAALTTTAQLAHVRGDLAAIERDAGRSVELFRALGDRWGLLQATEWLGGLAEMTGDFERAIALNRDGLRLAEELALPIDAAGRLAWLGWISTQLGDHPQAREYCEEALRITTEQDYPPGMVMAELGLAVAARRDGKLDIAEAHLGSLLAEARRQEALSGAPVVYLSLRLIELGYLAESRGDAATALARHREAVALARGMEAPRDLAGALEGLAAATALAGEHGEAARLLG